MAGTMLGRVWFLGFDRQPEGTLNRLQATTLAYFSDDGIRGLFLAEEGGFVTFRDGSRGWRVGKPHSQFGNVCFRSLESKNTQTVKHVLQRGPWVCVLFPISSIVVNVTNEEYHHRAFKLFDYGSSSDVSPCDFDGENLVVVDRTNEACLPIYRVIHLESNEQVEVDSVPKADILSLVKLWGSDCLACVLGRRVFLYDFKKRQVLFTFAEHRAEVVAMDASCQDRICTLSADAVVKVWSGTNGQCQHSFFIPEASYFLGYPYSVVLHDDKVLATADEGVFLVEFG